MKNTKLFRVLLIGALSVFMLSEIISCNSSQQSGQPGEEWKAPGDASKVANPLPDNATTLQKGKETYNLYCATCHGETGFGNGPARGPLGDQPANFHRQRFQKQTNGEIFWKMTTGRKDMPPFEKILSEEQRWQVVYYLRNLPDRITLKPPVALRPDIKVELFMEIDSLAVRILQNPKTGNLWYTTFNGDVLEIKNENGKRIQEKILSAKDHGIHILQGAAFLNNTIYLCGNVYSDNKRTTQGRMVRFDLDSSKKMTVVFNTVDYAANKTIYDHGWNGMVISPDNKFIYVNSGARTDHGEIQDNGGAYPKARDNALTSKVFRFPVNAKDLLLPDDEAKLKADGYLFARGIRNVYDMNFDADGNLFGVSNSADYDYPEDMFWLRQDHHYGFPWVMGGLENPQQYADWKPDPATDPFINQASHSWRTNYYYSDPEFPKKPAGIKFSPGVQNLGPDANEYRGHSGKIQDGDETGVPVSTFTAHCCPLGLFFDTKKILTGDLKGDGFVLRFTSGATSGLMQPFTKQGADLLHLKMEYDKITDNYFVKTVRIVEGFADPVDAVMIGNDVYIIEYGGRYGNIWKITLPVDSKLDTKTKHKS
ncbi:MAG TPA: c-type cytochrome [Chitinophagaceae bacterium]|nr:c-type cytochrome [Chitinophagaceae bacterium]